MILLVFYVFEISQVITTTHVHFILISCLILVAVRFIVQTWTRIRDAWLKNLNERAGRNPDCQPYKYDKHLQFLKKVVNVKYCDKIDQRSRRTRKDHRNESDSDVSDIIGTTDDGSECAETQPNRRKTRGNSMALKQSVYRDAAVYFDLPNKRQKTHEISTSTIPDSLTFGTETPQDDRHSAFFKSIQQTVTKFNDDQFLEYQAGVISLIRRIKNEQQYKDWDQPHTSTSAFQYSLELKRSPSTETFD